MKTVLTALLAAGVVGAAGCGGGDPVPNKVTASDGAAPAAGKTADPAAIKGAPRVGRTPKN